MIQSLLAERFQAESSPGNEGRIDVYASSGKRTPPMPPAAFE